MLSAYAVTSTLDTVDPSDDATVFTLREAILAANANPGTDSIEFNVGGGGMQSIQPLVALPMFTDPVVIDGTTQPGFAGSPLIEVDGTNVGTTVLQICAGGSTVLALAITNAPDTAIALLGGAGSLISNVDVSWAGGGQSGIGVVLSSSSGNTLQDLVATNRGNGIFLADSAGANHIVGATLSGNAIGLSISSSDNRVECSSILGNTIGVAVNGAAANIVLTDNHIAGNTSAGVQNSVAASVNAENNFWGAADGPSSLGGSGDAIVGSVDADPFLSSLPPCLGEGPVNVQIDVKPGSDPNAINVSENGVVAVAIFTTDAFDASQVNVSTVVFAGASAVHSALEDIDGDGDLDMVLHFRVQETELDEIYAQLVADDLNADGVLDSNKQEFEVTLTGMTLDDQLFEGMDGLELFLAGKSLRNLLDELAATGEI